MTVNLIRHGKTIANEKRLYAGFADIPLSEQGISELASLKGQLDYPTAGLYLCSGLVRTVQTLELLYDSPSFVAVPDLREINFGEFELHSHEQLVTRQEYQGWIADIDNRCPPNGEGKADFVARVASGMEQVRCLCDRAGADSVTIVTHGGVIAVVMEHLFPRERGFYDWQPQCGRGYAISLQTPQIQFTNI